MKVIKLITKILFVCSIILFSFTIFAFLDEKPKTNSTPIILQNDSSIENSLKNMSLEEKAGQVVFPALNGGANINSKEFKEYLHYVKDLKIGGVIFYIGSINQQAVLTNKLQELSKIPLLISSDFERGVSSYKAEGTLFPTNMAIGAANDSLLTYQMGKVISQEAISFGVYYDFAPVVDINNNPFNPIINVRSYGDNPALVSRLSNALIKGVQDGGMIATSKHFPGHGNTDVDSHKKLPIINASKAELLNNEFAPFISNFKNGVLSCMVSHLALPAYEPNISLPASLSYNVITGLLKKQLGFTGLIVTDALNMKAITNNYSDANAAVLALQAGNDCLLFPHNPDAYVNAIIKKAKSDKIFEERLNDAVRKILIAKKKLGLDKHLNIDFNNIKNVVGTQKHWDIAKALAEKSITLVKDSLKLIPILAAEKKYLQINVMDTPNGSNDEYFNQMFKQKLAGLEFEKVTTSTSKKNIDSIISKAKKYDLIILNVYLKVRAAKGTIDINHTHKEFIKKLLQMNRNVIFASHGNPYIISVFPEVSTYICNYGDAKVSEEALIKALLGKISIKGKLPVSIPHTIYKCGSGMQLLVSSKNSNGSGFVQNNYLINFTKSIFLNPYKIKFAPKMEIIASLNNYSKMQNNYLYSQTIKYDSIEKIINDGIVNKAYPGAVVLISHNGQILLNKGYGNYTYDSNSPSMSTETLFDLASVSKVIATTTAAMLCYDRNLFSLDDKVSKYIPAFGQNGKQDITIKNLLLHESGLPAFKNYYKPKLNSEEIISNICESKLKFAPGTNTLYSDLGMIMVGKIIEKVTKKTLDVFCREEIFLPLGMNNSMYNPPSYLKENCAPTEFDNYWRHRQLQGEVHDETASLLNGVAGHAGLFSTAEDISKLLQVLLDKGNFNGKSFINSETVSLFTSKNSENSTRALGWDTQEENSSSGALFGPLSYGHTGYTGTCLWIDPERNLFVIFLTNRVYPTRANNSVSEVRKQLNDQVIKTLFFTD